MKCSNCGHFVQEYNVKPLEDGVRRIKYNVFQRLEKFGLENQIRPPPPSSPPEYRLLHFGCVVRCQRTMCDCEKPSMTDWILEPKKAIPGTAENFRGKLHDVVPGLDNLSGEDLQRIIEDEDNEYEE